MLFSRKIFPCHPQWVEGDKTSKLPIADPPQKKHLDIQALKLPLMQFPKSIHDYFMS